jgi:hypothetical protein
MRNQILVHLSKDDCDSAESSWRATLADGTWLSGETLLRLACDSGIITAKKDGENVLDVGRKMRTIPIALRRALMIRDGGCRFPGCPHLAFVEGHHIRHWLHGGETSLANAVLLCPTHHHGVHDGHFTIERVGKDLMFIDADGDEIEQAPAPYPPETPTEYWRKAPGSGGKGDLRSAAQGLVVASGLDKVTPRFLIRARELAAKRVELALKYRAPNASAELPPYPGE